MKKILALIIMLSICLTSVNIEILAAGNSSEKMFEEGLEFFEKGDYDRAFARFQVSGDAKGYSPAQNMLGVCYRDGLGTEQDITEAERYFRLSAAQGYAEAEENLTALLESQVSVEDKSIAYQEAMNLFFAGLYEEAKAAFEALGDYERSADFVAMCDQKMENKEEQAQAEAALTLPYETTIQSPEIAWADNVKIGDYVVYGSYEQDNNTSNGKEPIEWLVLDAQPDKVLLISKDALESRQFNDYHAYVTWQFSTMRRWLNSDFYRDAFSEAEKLAVVSTEIRTEALSKNNSVAGDNTLDYVFLLSTAEAEQYFASNEARKCGMTSYASLHAATDQTKWWLRTSGTKNDSACFVDNAGGVHSSGDAVTRTGMCVRPAVWISRKQIIEYPVKEIIQETDVKKAIQTSIKSSAAGEYVVFGAYEQDNNLENGKEPIEWMILDVQDDHALLISKKALDTQRINPSSDNVTWEECMLRAWLNSAFYEEAFSLQEREQILWANVPADRNPKVSISTGNDTTDKVFLLSMSEATNLFLDDNQRKCEPTAYARTKGAHLSSNAMTYWWLRTITQGSDAYVNNDGLVDYRGDLQRNDFAVRPAIWISLEDDVELPPIEENLSELTKRMLSTLSVGDIIPFGEFDQDNNFADGKEQIEWQVLDVKGDRALLISKDALAVMPYHAVEDASKLVESTWDTSSIRQWLNTTFLNYAFSKAQQQMVLTEIVKAENNPYTSTDPGKSTYDKVFLLSVQEVELYLHDLSSRECSPTENARLQKAYISSNGKTWWWLRSPGMGKVYAAAVHGDGEISNDQALNKIVVAVRPAIWISIEN